MKAKKLIENISVKQITGELEQLEIIHVETNSKQCKENSVFICLKGLNADSHNYAQEAADNGAILLVVEHFVDVNIPQVLVENTRKAWALISANFFDNPSKKLKMIGVTGTNGKTTTTFLCKQVLEYCNKKVGLIGTEGVWIGDMFFESHLTTPDPFALQSVLSQMVEHGCEYCVMEVSAHAISLSKIEGIVYDVGLITNISQDHLDFFENMEEYALCKLSFIASSQVAIAIVNGDDARCLKLKDISNKRVVLFSRENPADIFCTNVELSKNGTTFFLNAHDGVCSIFSPLCGDFNVDNALSVISICYHLGFPLAIIAQALRSVLPVPGRFHIMELGQGRNAVIDFAHTPESLKKILMAVSEICPKPIICLFGFSGNRDRTKRAIMAQVAEENSNFVVVTSDNPKYEKPEFIMYEICKGFKKSNHILIPDRRVAVSIGLEYLSEGGTLVLCGKGDEKYQDINGIETPYSDLKEVEKFLNQERLLDENEASEC